VDLDSGRDSEALVICCGVWIRGDSQKKLAKSASEACDGKKDLHARHDVCWISRWTRFCSWIAVNPAATWVVISSASCIHIEIIFLILPKQDRAITIKHNEPYRAVDKRNRADYLTLTGPETGKSRLRKMLWG
jgi:hypothetical protein